MDYRWLDDLPPGHETFPVYDFRNVHIEILGNVSRKNLDAAKEMVRNQGDTDVMTGFAALFAFNFHADNTSDFIFMQKTADGTHFHWFSPSERDLSGTNLGGCVYLMSFVMKPTGLGIFQHNKYSIKRANIDISNTMYDEYGKNLVWNAISLGYLGLVKPAALIMTKQKIEQEHVYTVSIAPKYLREVMNKKTAPLQNESFRKELKVARERNKNRQVSLEQGYVYGVTHPSFVDWIKLGSCVDTVQRLSQYQVGDPLERYVMTFAIFTDAREKIEHLIHERLAASRGPNEWFAVSVEQAKSTVEQIVTENES